MASPKISVTEQDLQRLRTVLDVAPRSDASYVDALESELARANVVDQKRISADVVTMNSRVRYVDSDSGKERDVVLVYPQNADMAQGRISILSPIGAALIGLKKGQTIEWVLPNGRTRKITVLDVPYQPEAAGDWNL